MKKLFIALSCYLISMAANAQKREPSLIITGGLNLANITESAGGKVDDAKTLTSFHAGLLVDLPFNAGLAFQPGLLISGKGSKVQDGNPSDNNYYKATINPIYIEMPINFVASICLPGKAAILLGAGPYVAMGIAGKNKVEGKYLGVGFKSENTIEFSNDDSTTLNYEEDAGIGKMKRLDVGANVLGGIEIGKIMLRANYGFGFNKINSGGDNNTDNKNKNRVLGFSLGVKL